MEGIIMRKKIDKGLLAILLSVVCGLIVIGATLIIYDHVSNDEAQQSTTTEDDGWTDNY